MTYDLFLLADAIFLSSVKIFSFISRLLLTVETISLSNGKHLQLFSIHSCQWKQFFCLVESFFIYSSKWKLLFYLTFILFYSIFSFQGKSFFCTFCIFLLTVAIFFSLQVKKVLLSREKHFQSFFIYFSIGNHFSAFWKDPSKIFHQFFLVETIAL